MTDDHNQIKQHFYKEYKAILEDWIPPYASIAIAVIDKYVYFTSSDQKLQLSLGEKVRENSIAHKVLTTRAKVDTIMDNSLFNTPYYGIGYPIEIEHQPAALIVILPPIFKERKPETYRFLTGKQKDDWSPILIKDISHIESLQKSTWFYAKEQQYKTSITLKELETRLPEAFVRIHRSYIINIHFIKKISRDLSSNFIIILNDSTELPVSQSYINNLRSILEF